MGKHPLGVGGEKQQPSIGEAVASIQADECPGLVKQFFVAEVTDGLGEEHAAELLKDRLIDIFGSILTAEGMLEIDNPLPLLEPVASFLGQWDVLQAAANPRLRAATGRFANGSLGVRGEDQQQPVRCPGGVSQS